jgi:CRISPR-associated endonuclease/helicase Cas3
MTSDAGAADELLTFWGKAQPNETARFECHPLVYHSLAVAGLGEALLAARPGERDLVAGWLALPATSLGRLVSFLPALHDIGKLTRTFQCQRPGRVPRADGHKSGDGARRERPGVTVMPDRDDLILF